MAKRDGGLLIFFDEQQRGTLLRLMINGTDTPFSDALSVPDLPVKGRGVALLAFSESTVDYIALVQKGNRVATSKSRVEFFDIVDLRALPIADIEKRLGSDLKRFFIRSSRGIGGAIPQQTWSAVTEAAKALRPDAANDVDRLLSLQRYADTRFSGGAAEILLQERDAVGTILDIFSGNNKLREQVLRSWAPSEDAVTGDKDTPGARLELAAGTSSFLSGIPTRFFQEESALQQDLFNWNGAAALHDSGISVFRQGDRILEVIYANRNALEKTLGVDLIYYHQGYEMFVLVQYKLMKEEADGFVYRPDAQLDKEIARMDRFSEVYSQASELREHRAYRLNPDGFMLKLVPNRGLSPASGELIKGMYLTRGYAKFLLGPHGPQGKQGGAVLTFDNAPRYLSNTEFIQAVSRGWIGTSGVQSDALKRIILEYVATSRALVIGYETRIGSAKG